MEQHDSPLDAPGHFCSLLVWLYSTQSFCNVVTCAQVPGRVQRWQSGILLAVLPCNDRVMAGEVQRRQQRHAVHLLSGSICLPHATDRAMNLTLPQLAPWPVNNQDFLPYFRLVLHPSPPCRSRIPNRNARFAHHHSNACRCKSSPSPTCRASAWWSPPTRSSPPQYKPFTYIQLIRNRLILIRSGRHRRRLPPHPPSLQSRAFPPGGVAHAAHPLR